MGSQCLDSSNIVLSILTLPRWWALSWRGRRSWRGWSTWPGSQSIGSPTRRWRYHAAETGSVIEYKVYNYLLTSITCPFKKTDAWSVNSNKIKGGKTTALRIRNQSEPIAHIKTFKLKVSLVIYLKRVMRNFLNFSFKLFFKFLNFEQKWKKKNLFKYLFFYFSLTNKVWSGSAPYKIRDSDPLQIDLESPHCFQPWYYCIHG